MEDNLSYDFDVQSSTGIVKRGREGGMNISRSVGPTTYMFGSIKL